MAEDVIDGGVTTVKADALDNLAFLLVAAVSVAVPLLYAYHNDIEEYCGEYVMFYYLALITGLFCSGSMFYWLCRGGFR